MASYVLRNDHIYRKTASKVTLLERFKNYLKKNQAMIAISTISMGGNSFQPYMYEMIRGC